MKNGFKLTRRGFLAGAAGAAAVAGAGAAGFWPSRASARVLVVGGGPGGVALALGIKARAPRAEILLIERDPTRLAPSRGSGLIHGALPGGDFAMLQAAGVEIAIDEIRNIDWRTQRARGLSGRDFAFDRLALAPGIAARDEAIAGYDARAAYEFPHAFTGSRGARRLAAQIEAMPQGGVMIIRAPAGPQRYPQGPYERASAVARYLMAKNPRAKLLILDDKEEIPEQQAFLRHWQREFPGMIEWVAASAGGQVRAIETQTRTLETSAGPVRGDVINFIPAQRAGEIAALAGLVDQTGWCPADGRSMRSLAQQSAFIIGDAVAGAADKQASSARHQAHLCATAMSLG